MKKLENKVLLQWLKQKENDIDELEKERNQLNKKLEDCVDEFGEANKEVEELQKDLPVVILEKWEDFDAEKVITTYPNYSWNNIDKYTMDYYKDNYIL